MIRTKEIFHFPFTIYHFPFSISPDRVCHCRCSTDMCYSLGSNGKCKMVNGKWKICSALPPTGKNKWTDRNVCPTSLQTDRSPQVSSCRCCAKECRAQYLLVPCPIPLS